MLRVYLLFITISVCTASYPTTEYQLEDFSIINKNVPKLEIKDFNLHQHDDKIIICRQNKTGILPKQRVLLRIRPIKQHTPQILSENKLETSLKNEKDIHQSSLPEITSQLNKPFKEYAVPFLKTDKPPNFQFETTRNDDGLLQESIAESMLFPTLSNEYGLPLFKSPKLSVSSLKPINKIIHKNLEEHVITDTLGKLAQEYNVPHHTQLISNPAATFSQTLNLPVFKPVNFINNPITTTKEKINIYNEYVSSTKSTVINSSPKINLSKEYGVPKNISTITPISTPASEYELPIKSAATYDVLKTITKPFLEYGAPFFQPTVKPTEQAKLLPVTKPAIEYGPPLKSINHHDIKLKVTTKPLPEYGVPYFHHNTKSYNSQRPYSVYGVPRIQLLKSFNHIPKHRYLSSPLVLHVKTRRPCPVHRQIHKPHTRYGVPYRNIKSVRNIFAFSSPQSLPKQYFTLYG